jgi:heptosyltransferase-2
MAKEKILVVQTAFLGDAVLTLPMIQFLKDRFKDSLLDVLCIPSTSELFSYSPFVNDVIIYDKKGIHKSFKSIFEIARFIKERNYTKIYSPHRSFRTAVIIYLTKIKSTFGFDNSSLKYVYKHLVHYDKNIHEVARNLKLAGFEVIEDNWKILPQVRVPTDAKNKIEKLIGNKKEKIAAVAPGSVWQTKVYPKEYFSKITEYLIKHGYFVYFIGGKEDQTLCEILQSEHPENSSSTAGNFSIIESIALLKNCSVLVTNDSAPTHLAMIADIPTLTIYCSTIPDFGFYPYNSQSNVISFDALKCKPCGIHGKNKCPIKTFDCGFNLHPDLINAKLYQILSSALTSFIRH